ncbi:PepSY domain-containing protein [Novosphingobium sp. G106]|uniref:PepSY domain-containing protein n=1 Tax=Novosphingobium sp. G106 TaxID=2849500 RepID=UPI0035C7BF81
MIPPVGATATDTANESQRWSWQSVRFPMRLTSVSLPSPKSPVYQVRLRRPGEWRIWSGSSFVMLEAGSGRILSTYDAANGPLANRILDSAFPVHSGEAAGLPGRILVALAGLSLPLLYATGLWAWLRRRRINKSIKACEASNPINTGFAA